MIKILIERRIMPGLEAEYEAVAREAMRQVLGAPGFGGGESLTEQGHDDRRLVITKWRDLNAWKAWRDSEQRGRVMQDLYPLLTEEEHVRIFAPSY
ncbi:antibiotic biosynthesis monooxygenase family protein [Halomonas organivorans]|uniref:Heme-degrading monooxygenase HmoA n=1 Tax=Halomonas organivorans TaxID=257772 RepID=A0A7W5C0T1_9GAMM|nr:antibiotic biosynthesis monooxygenase family protein [Halomonas organivorans]MBB3142707.1 heme-degrading monooxygenase HmoA [Halomonas organivorans]